MRRLHIFILLVVLMLSACQERENSVPLPTQAKPEEVQTAIFKTQNAPPPGFESIGFNPVDFNRDKLPKWAVEITVNFSGQYTATSEAAAGYLIMRIWEDNVGRRRRVLLQFEGQALSGGVSRIEAVRIENDFYLLDANRICTINSDAAEDIATLTAGRIVGGFTLGIPTGHKTEINGYPAYQYGFDKNNLQVMIFQEQPSTVEILGGEAWLIPELNEPSTVEILGGEAWLIPELNVIGRFAVAMNVHNAKILFGENAVTGELSYQYNLLPESEQEDIAIPNGC